MPAIYNDNYGEVLRCVGDVQPSSSSTCGTGCMSCGATTGCGCNSQNYVQPANGHIIYGDNCNTGQITDTYYIRDTSKLYLGNVSNLQMGGGTQEQVLATDGYRNLYWTDRLRGEVQPSINWSVAASGNNQQFAHPNLTNFTSNAYATVFRNGVLVQQDDYTISGSLLTLNVQLSAGDTIDVAATGANVYVTSPGGSTTQVQYNFNGQFAGIPTLTYDAFTGLLQAQNLSAGNTRISNVATPVLNSDAATKAYVDSVAQGLNFVDPVQVLQSAPLTGTYTDGPNPATPGIGATLTLGIPLTTVDGISLTTGDRVLVQNQLNAAENGVYVIDGTGLVLTRASDADTPSELQLGSFIFVEGGTVFGGSGYVQTGDIVTIGTSAVIFSQFSSAGAYVGANGVQVIAQSIELVEQPNIVVGTYGNSTLIPVITVNDRGIITGITTEAIGIGNVGNLSLNGNSNTFLDGTGNWQIINTSNANGTVTSVGGTGSGLGFSLGGIVTSEGNLQLTVPTVTDLRTNINVGNVANLYLSGNNQQVLSGDGSWVALSSGGNTLPGGLSGQLQFNNGGNAFGGIPSTIYTGGKLTLGSNSQVGILGGTNGQILSTDGAGNLYWASVGAATGNISGINLNGNPSTYLNGAGSWVPITSSTGGTVTSVATTGSGLGFSLTGGTIVSSGTVTLNVPDANTLKTNIGLAGYPSLPGNAQLYLNGLGSWTQPPSTGGNAVPAGSNSQVQFNQNGVFGADSGFTYNPSTDSLYIANTVQTSGITKLRYGTETFSATSGSSGTLTMDVMNNSTLWGTTNLSSNITLAVRGNSTTTFSSMLDIYDSMSIAAYLPTGGTGYIINAMTIDGALQTINWVGGVTPSAVNNATELFQFQIVKTGASSYRVLGSMTRF